MRLHTSNWSTLLKAFHAVGLALTIPAHVAAQAIKQLPPSSPTIQYRFPPEAIVPQVDRPQIKVDPVWLPRPDAVYPTAPIERIPSPDASSEPVVRWKDIFPTIDLAQGGLGTLDARNRDLLAGYIKTHKCAGSGTSMLLTSAGEPACFPNVVLGGLPRIELPGVPETVPTLPNLPIYVPDSLRPEIKQIELKPGGFSVVTPKGWHEPYRDATIDFLNDSAKTPGLSPETIKSLDRAEHEMKSLDRNVTVQPRDAEELLAYGSVIDSMVKNNRNETDIRIMADSMSEHARRVRHGAAAYLWVQVKLADGNKKPVYKMTIRCAPIAVLRLEDPRAVPDTSMLIDTCSRGFPDPTTPSNGVVPDQARYAFWSVSGSGGKERVTSTCVSQEFLTTTVGTYLISLTVVTNGDSGDKYPLPSCRFN